MIRPHRRLPRRKARLRAPRIASPASGRNAARVPVAAILAWLIAGVALLAVSIAALLVSERFGTPVTITVDGYTQSFRTTQPDVAGLLADQGLALRPEDRVSPAPETRLAPDLAVTIVRARPGLVDADGRLHQVYTQARTVGELIQSAGVRLGAYDEIWLDGAQVAPETALPPPARQEARTALRQEPRLVRQGRPARASPHRPGGAHRRGRRQRAVYPLHHGADDRRGAAARTGEPLPGRSRARRAWAAG